MSNLRNVEILGGGPAGLYAAILLRRWRPDLPVRVTEQNPKGATFGFGVVFSDKALDFLAADDPETHALVTPLMERWRNMNLDLPAGREVLDGVGFSAIGRLELIEALRMRAEALGVDIRFDTRIEDPRTLEADLVIGTDGLNSLVRDASPEGFQPHWAHFTNHFAWFGTPRAFDALTQTFVDTEWGPFNAHHYRFAPDRSTFIVECGEETYAAAGFAQMDEAESAAFCEKIFADTLDGAPLITNKSQWRRFPRLWCDSWVSGRQVILGDAAHTAHFSIGSGTRLAMEDAIALVAALKADADVDAALAAWDAARKPIAKKIVDAANTSAQWYEGFGEKMQLAPVDFAFDYLTRSGRMDMDRLRGIAPEFMARYDAARPDGPAAGAAPAEDPLADLVPDGAPGAAEIGFDRAAHPNCSEILWRNLARNPERTAVTGPGGTLSYAELIAEAARWGHALTRFGLARGERIAFFLEDSPSFAAAFYGAVRAGFVPVLLNTQTKPDVLNYFLKDSGARLALCDHAFLPAFGPETRAGAPLERIIVANGPAEDADQAAEADFLAGMPTALDAADTGPDDMAFWMYSSGSTGRPKGIVHLHHDMAYIEASYGQTVLKLTPEDICFSVPKAFFAYGFGNSFVFPFAIGAATLLMPGQPRPGAVLDCIEAFRPTVLFGLPTLYTAIAHSEGVASRDLSSLRQSMSAAETLSAEIYQAWKDLTGHGPTEGLGSTEMLHIYLSNTLDDHRLGAAGARVPGYEIRLIAAGGADAKPGEEGVMEVRAHSSAPCYWNRPDKTAETMRHGWIHTGDRFVERDGYYYFQGRADDLIKVSGQWVWPLEVERCLNEHADVHAACVLAHKLPDDRMALRAAVQLKAGAVPGPEMTAALRDFVKARLTPFKRPGIVEYWDALPATGTGKIDRQAVATAPLREEIAAAG